MMDFTPGFDSSTLFQNSWSIISGTYDPSQQKADYSCKTSTSTTAGVLSPYYKLYPQGFQVTSSAQQQPYQFTYADILYFTTASDLIDFNMVDQQNNVATSLLGSTGDQQNQQCAYQISCSKNSPLKDVVEFSLSYNKQFISQNPVTSFTYDRNPVYGDWFGLLKIVIWSNCVENCLTCQDANNCKVCIKGFNQYTLSNGNKVCEETSGCKTTNCFSCIKNSDLNLNKCVKCNPGYTLDSIGNCLVQNNCSSSQYYSSSDKACVNYQSLCLMQVSGQYNQWQACAQAVSTSIIKCPKEKTILIYELKNYKVLTCDCKVDYCDVCQNAQTCDSCKTGYQLNSQKTLCTFNACPQGQSKDPNSGFCVANCPGTNCLTCNNTQCLSCLSNANYYIDQSNPQNCVTCNITNCQTCSGDGKCSVCVSGYTLSIDKLSCNSCSVQNCIACQSNSSTLCSQCAPNYLKSGDSTYCACNVNGCLKCQQNDGSKCLTCANNYIQNNNLCQCQVNNCQICNPIDGAKCLLCNAGLTYNTQNNTCYCPIKNCISCSNQVGQCQTCQLYYLLSSDSQNCTCNLLNCQICDPNDGSICLQCNTGYTVDSNTNQCKSTIKNCLTTQPNSSNQCQFCQNNYLLDSSQQCQCQVDNCQICSPNDGKLCDVCKSGYNKNINSQCQSSLLNCLAINANDITKCQVCQKNYQLDSSFQCQCQAQNCKSCSSSDGNICLQCSQGYVLDQSTNQYQTTKQCVCSVQNCQICSDVNGQICKTCIKNYMGPQCLCQVQNCSICSIQDGNICDTCNLGYKWNNQTNKCDAIPKCLVQNCDQCQLNNSNSCSQCSDGYSILINSQQNTSPINICQKTNACMVDGCQTCSQTNNNMCLKCNDPLIVKNLGKLCQSIDLNDFDVIYKATDIGYNVTISFQENLVNFNLINYEKILSIEITGIQNYTYQVTNVLNNKIYLSIKVDQNCKNQKLEVKLHDPNFVQINNIQNNYKEVQLSSYVVQSQNQQQQAQAAKTASQSMQTTLLYSMLSIAMIGNFYVLFNTIDLTTFIYFLMFVNVRYPSNVTAFCSIFQNFQMAFIPNVFQVYLTDPNYIQPNTPGKFMDYGNDAYLLNSSGQSFTIVFGILAIYIFIKLFSFIKIPGFQLYLQKKIESGWEYNAFFDLIWTVYMYVVVGVFLQFYKFEFTESLSFLNYTLFSMSFIAMFVIPIMIAIFISKTPNLNDPRIQKQFSSIVGGLKVGGDSEEKQQRLPSIENKIGSECNINEDQINKKSKYSEIAGSLKNKKIKYQERVMRYSKYTNVFLYFRKIAYAIFIIYLFDCPYVQLILISLLNAFLAFFYFYICPQDKQFENIRNGLSEVFLIVMQICAGILVDDKQDQDEQERINIGWVLIGSASFILLMHIFTVVIDLFRFIFNLKINYKK
ncbi:hypothetical protein TTHERM_01178750 (macronuclear) [Tetrahymena thermophila SB210]|uniref:EGF-like domain-containing protein n=1 Tax=Tetrahymena thermophila (strain SB210) TaxID=312017 RepID=Q22KY2_TETTS|nr:hypothetical protein TTHERM_01178750 [Tetrahymena thermophila SB210]EAR85946.3 hypothetical protein TTHERM_01178750 [Tetrahymena thermophila SB210]|eukprot:XP_976541.3 hypothetical protein TTHERM_01178750 [Tetrahymena thermophila SB210]